MNTCPNCGYQGDEYTCPNCGGAMVPAGNSQYGDSQNSYYSNNSSYSGYDQNQNAGYNSQGGNYDQNNSYNQGGSYSQNQGYGQQNYNSASHSQNQDIAQNFLSGQMGSYSPQGTNIPPEYAPISMWGYFGYQILFAIPCIGIILLCVFAFGGTQNINLKNFARSYFCSLIIGLVLLLIFWTSVMSMIGGAAYYYR